MIPEEFQKMEGKGRSKLRNFFQGFGVGTSIFQGYGMDATAWGFRKCSRSPSMALIRQVERPCLLLQCWEGVCLSCKPPYWGSSTFRASRVKQQRFFLICPGAYRGVHYVTSQKPPAPDLPTRKNSVRLRQWSTVCSIFPNNQIDPQLLRRKDAGHYSQSSN